MIEVIQNIVRKTDAAIASVYLSVRRERSALISFLFHSLFKDMGEIGRNLVDPLERTTVSSLRQLVEYYQEHGYRFVSPPDLLNGLSAEGKYALITFDDGYFNNSLALHVLEGYKVPATFFISTEHVRQNKCFWWDVLYRERSAQGASRRQIYREAMSMKSLRTADIEAKLLQWFGSKALTPRGDIDRPFTPAELRDFARSPYVHLGNHTANHDILTNYTSEEIRRLIAGAQDSLREMTGVCPIAIAYPNGAHTDAIVQTCSDLGLKIGFTIRPEKVAIPIESRSLRLLRLGRFCPTGEDAMASQCRTYRSDLLLYGKFRGGYLRLVHAQR